MSKVLRSEDAPPITQDERTGWALSDLLAAIDRWRANMGDPALAMAVIARKNDYDLSRTATARAREARAAEERQARRIAARYATPRDRRTA